MDCWWCAAKIREFVSPVKRGLSSLSHRRSLGGCSLLLQVVATVRRRLSEAMVAAWLTLKPCCFLGCIEVREDLDS